MTVEFLETPTFPDRIAMNVEVAPGWNTRIVQLKSGFEKRNMEWGQARLRFNIASALQSTEEWEEVLSYLYCLGGQATGFRIRHPKDHDCTTANGYVTSAGTGDGTPSGQLFKVYTLGALTYAREIKKPRSGVAIYYDGAPLAPTPSVDTTSGIVTFGAFDTASVLDANPASGAVTTLELSDALAGLTSGDKVYLSGLGGTIGTVLNGVAHTVLGVTGSPGSILDLDVDSDGLAYTSGGTAAFYPQASKTLRWTGDFDVPVRFGTDAVALLMKTVDFQRMSDVPLLEIRVA